MTQETNATATRAARLAMQAMKAWRESDGTELRRIRELLAMEPGGSFDEECCELLEAVTERMCIALDYAVMAPGAPAVWLELLMH
ncbi:MAG: hypothetical protein NTY38_16945, partial [Acidobacteria bacterium]|nr:hypothetical protein [Acidobacteriota bacterium]